MDIFTMLFVISVLGSLAFGLFVLESDAAWNRLGDWIGRRFGRKNTTRANAFEIEIMRCEEFGETFWFASVRHLVSGALASADATTRWGVKRKAKRLAHDMARMARQNVEARVERYTIHVA